MSRGPFGIPRDGAGSFPVDLVGAVEEKARSVKSKAQVSQRVECDLQGVGIPQIVEGFTGRVSGLPPALRFFAFEANGFGNPVLLFVDKAANIGFRRPDRRANRDFGRACHLETNRLFSSAAQFDRVAYVHRVCTGAAFNILRGQRQRDKKGLKIKPAGNRLSNSSVAVFDAFDVVFPEIGSGLHFDDHQVAVGCVFQAMRRPPGDVGRHEIGRAHV